MFQIAIVPFDFVPELFLREDAETAAAALGFGVFAYLTEVVVVEYCSDGDVLKGVWYLSISMKIQVSEFLSRSFCLDRFPKVVDIACNTSNVEEETYRGGGGGSRYKFASEPYAQRTYHVDPGMGAPHPTNPHVDERWERPRLLIRHLQPVLKTDPPTSARSWYFSWYSG